MKENLLILGAGQYGKVALDIARAMNSFDRIDFLDDEKDVAIGSFQDYQKFADTHRNAVVAIGNPSDRIQWLEALKESGFVPAKLIHPTAVISSAASLEAGTIVEPMVVVHPGAVVGKGCILSAGAVVNHDSVVEEGCHVGCNASIASDATLPRFSKVENNTSFREDESSN